MKSRRFLPLADPMNLVQFAGLWTLAHYPNRPKEWSLDRKLRTIKEEGFKGLCASLDGPITNIAQQQGLFTIGMIFPDEPGDYARLLKAQQNLGARWINVQLGSHDLSPASALKRWLLLEKQAGSLGLELSLETHRDSATETPEKIFELSDRYEKATGGLLKLTWDFSHLGIVKHLHTGQHRDRLLARRDLVQNATQFHFRPFNSHHAQLPVKHKGRLTPEVVDYLDFVQEVMRIWKESPQNKERAMFACPLLGPKGGYALSNFPDVWSDALVLSRELTARWKKAQSD